MAHLIVWQFDVSAEHRVAFERAYAADGDWAALFGRAQGFLGTALLASDEVGGRYLTIDRWRDAESFHAFKCDWGAEYAALDRALEGIAGVETRIGSFRG